MTMTQRPDMEDEERLCRMFREYGDGLLRLCCMHLHDYALAEDAVQETFLKAARSLGNFRGISGEKTWLSRIAINVCRDMRRSNWLRHMDMTKALEELPEPAESFSEPDDTVFRAVCALKPKYREVILLYYYQHLSLNEMAEALQRPAATVTTRLHRAREILRPMLEGGYLDEE